MMTTNQTLITDVLLGDETFGGGLFPDLYEQAEGWVLTSKQLPAERRSWKNDLFAYRKQTVELQVARPKWLKAFNFNLHRLQFIF